MHVGMLARVVLLTSALTAPAAAQVPQHADRTGTAAALKSDMRKLWTDHVVWTRDYIIAAVDNKPDAPAALNRLMKNQDDIGAAVGKYYGGANGQKLTSLLKEHIAQAGDVVKAAKDGDKPALKQASDKWDLNAVAIADFLSTANPNLPRATLVDMMRKHLSTTTNEVQMRLNKDWDGDVRAFDAVYDHILMMSDALAAGIVKQFPDKFGTTTFN
jgi:hypothetical protein